MSKEKKTKNVEKIVRNILIVLTIISLMITTLHLTYLCYQNENIVKINAFLISFIDQWLLWVDNILLYIFAIFYIVLAIQSKSERVLKITFSIFSIFSTMIVFTFIMNFIAELFGMFS